MKYNGFWFVALVAIAGTVVFPLASSAQPSAPNDMKVERAWAGATPGAVRTGAVYLTVINEGAPDRITGISTPLADEAGMHESSNDNGVMRMRPVPSLSVPRGKTVTFAPGGYHIMLLGLKRPLKQGDTFPLTLTFERSTPITVTVRVERVGASAPSVAGANSGNADVSGAK